MLHQHCVNGLTLYRLTDTIAAMEIGTLQRLFGVASQEVVMAQAQVQAQPRRNRQVTPERWQAALARALAERVTVRQVNANGMWVATSGTDTTMAYLLEVTGGIVHSCTCPAGQFDDPICKHRARWYYDAGLLDLHDPEPDPPALGASIASLSAHAEALRVAA
jgi:hypothetical protein